MSHSSSLITIRSWHSGDERELTALFQRAFGRAISEDHWRWKLKGQASAVDNVWLAINDDKPVFQYAGIPTRFWLSQAPSLAMVSVDTMTAPEFRRRGLLTRVAQQVYAAWRERNVAFVLGLPNENWGSRAGALGWRPLFPLQWLVRPLQPEAILARRLRMPILERATLPGMLWNRFLRSRMAPDPHIQTERVRHADAAFDRIWEGCRADWKFSTVRDREWVNWRFLSSPSKTYALTLARRMGTPTGYLAHTLIENEGRVYAYLAEMFAARADDATCNTLLSGLIDELSAAKTESLTTLAVPGTAHFRWLRRAGFLPRRSFCVQMVPLAADLPVNLMLDPDHWNLTGADFDVI